MWKRILIRGSTSVFTYSNDILIMAIGAILGGAGSLMGGASSLFSGIGAGRRQRQAQDWQEKMNKQNQQFQKDYSKYATDLDRETQQLYWEKYNSPSAQRAAYTAAGINPFVEGSVMQPMQADSSTPTSGAPGYPTAPDYVTPGMGAIQNFGAGLSTLGVQIENLRADVALKNAQRSKVESETVSQNNQNSLFPLLKATSEMDYLSKGYRTEVDRVQSELAPYLGQLQTEEGRAKVADIWASANQRLSAAAKTDADRENAKLLVKAQIPNLEADTALKGQQAATESSKRSELGASADLKSAQTETENTMRDSRKRLTETQVDGLLSTIGLNSIKADRDKYENFLRFMNSDDATTAAGIAQKVTRIWKSYRNEDLSDYQKALISDYLEDIWSGKKP